MIEIETADGCWEVKQRSTAGPGVLQHRDIEKGIVRTPGEVLGLLGTKSGESVVLVGVEKRGPDEFWMKTARAAALTASQESTVQCAQPILLYRAPSGAIANEIMAIGITAAALGLNFVIVVRELFDPVIWAAYSIPITALLLGVSIVLAFLAAFWKTRAAVR